MAAVTGEGPDRLLDYLQSFLTAERRLRIEEVLARRTRYVTVVLDNVIHSHNISAVLRSCDAFGVQDVHVIEQEQTVKVARDIALGADRWLTIHRYREVDDPGALCIRTLREGGYRILVTLPQGEAIPVREVDLSRPVALVMGHEKAGVSEQMIAAADGAVTVPMHGFARSLNVSVAAAVCLHELTDRVRRSEVSWRLTPEECAKLRLQWTRQSISRAASIERRFFRSLRIGSAG